jgi:multicomponent Na+:H+ antiporter subunit F
VTATAAVVLLTLAGGPAVVGLCRGTPVARLAALEVLSVVLIGVLVLLSAVYGRRSYLDVAMLTALLSFAGTLVFARFFGRSL